MTKVREATTEIEIPFHDVDALRIVWHGHYYKYMEIARTSLFRAVGLDVPFFAERGLALVVIESRCRHTASLQVGDIARVTARFVEVPERIGVAYQITNRETGVHVARARTLLVAVDSSGRFLHPLPEVVRERLPF